MKNTRKDCLNNVHNIRPIDADRNFPSRFRHIGNTNCKKYKIKTPPSPEKTSGEFIFFL